MAYQYNRKKGYEALIQNAVKNNRVDTAAVYKTASRQYEDPYKKQRIQAIQDYQKKTLEYDPETDPQVKRLMENYIDQGQRDVQDTVADVSAGTGGIEEISQTASRQYEDPYKQQRLQAIQDYQNKKFEYDPETDPQVKKLRENYIAQGQRAMRDTVADVSARTGGMASSYAQIAGQQIYQQYMEGLSDQERELYTQKYNQYLDELSRQAQAANLLGQESDRESSDYYKRIGQAMERWAALGEADSYVAQALGVQEGAKTTDEAYRQWQRDFQEKTWDQEQKTAKSDTDYARALEKAQTLGAAGDFSGYKNLGYSDQETKTLQDWYRKQMAAAAAGSGSGSGSGTKKEAYSKTAQETAQGLLTAAAKKKGSISEDTAEILESMGISRTMIQKDFGVTIGQANQAAGRKSNMKNLLKKEIDTGNITWNVLLANIDQAKSKGLLTEEDENELLKIAAGKV